MKEIKHMKEIRIFNHPWHIAHQYELMKTPGTKWSWLINARRTYNEAPRGDVVKKFGIDWVDHYEPGKYDVAILHVDQQCFEDILYKRGKGSLYRELNEVITDIPKIVINHGTPYYPEMFPPDITEDNYEEKGFTKGQIGMSSVLINRCKEVIGDNWMVVNSHDAKEQWGHGTTIIHGLDEDEWFDLPKEPRIITTLSPAGLDKYYDRQFFNAVKEELEERDIYLSQVMVDVRFDNHARPFDEYREFIGRSLIYFHPMKEAPMSRGRTEAMFSGCCIVSTPTQDTTRFIRNGENGFIIKRNPIEVADLLEKLLYDYKTAIKIGKAGKETALDKFKGSRYRQTWRNLLEYVIENHKINQQKICEEKE
jgi:glycosyltransferase involved in cell wall biosynthesis